MKAKQVVPPKNNPVSEDPLYIGIYSAQTVQKTILESSKSIIELLKDYEVIAHVRQQKKEAFLKFDKTIEELKTTIETLRKQLPTEVLKEHKKVESALLKKPAKKPVHQVRNAQLDELDKELADIESKLSKLN